MTKNIMRKKDEGALLQLKKSYRVRLNFSDKPKS